MRYCGVAYVIWLAFKFLRSTMVPGAKKISNVPATRGHFMAEIVLHITNPKPIRFFGMLFSTSLAWDS